MLCLARQGQGHQGAASSPTLLAPLEAIDQLGMDELEGLAAQLNQVLQRGIMQLGSGGP